MIAALLLGAILAQAPVPVAPPAVSLRRLPALRLSAPRAGLSVQVAANPAQREQGLMNVRELPPRTGMLFVFPRESGWSFWMKNTLIDLDMVWIDKRGVVTSVAARVPHASPQTPDERIPVRDGYGAYVIELPAGEAHEDGLMEGVRVGGLPPLPPE
ncbi:MAG: DUF192 domain-containing protein [bacterium]|nr:DUF192 domain-containing protein [bacterium]